MMSKRDVNETFSYHGVSIVRRLFVYLHSEWLLSPDARHFTDEVQDKPEI